MSFLYQNHQAGYPVGSIIQYIGTSDPDGWIICNGIKRTEMDGRFSALANILNQMEKRVLNSIGNAIVNDANNCTPPDLTEKIMCGKSTDQIGSIGGSKSQTLEYTNIPSHTHTIKDDGHDHGGKTEDHTHTFSATKHKHTISNDSHNHSYTKYASLNKQWAGSNEVWFDEETRQTSTSKTGITIDESTTRGTITKYNSPIPDGEANISLQDTGKETPDSFNIIPPYFVINHIIKY